MTPARPLSTGRRTLLNAAALTGSNLWRIAISFLLQILVARRLGLEALGHYTLLMACLNIGQILSEVGLPLLLVRDLARQPSLRRATLRRALLIQGAASLIAAAGLALLSGLLPVDSPLRPALWWIAASFPFYAILSVGETLFQAAERMELVLGVEGAINLLTLLASIVVLWRQGTVVELAAVVALAQVVSVLLALWLVVRGRFLAGTQRPAAEGVTGLVRQAMPFFGLALADVLLQRLDILLVGLVGGATLAGLYSAAYNLLRVAVKLIQSVWRALYPTLSRLSAQTPERYRQLSAWSLRYGLLGCVAPAVIGMALAPEILTLLYGPEFLDSAPVLRILIWIMPLFFLETAVVTQLLVEQRARDGLWLTALHVAALGLLLPLGSRWGGVAGAAWAALLAQFSAVAAAGIMLRSGRQWLAALAAHWPVLVVTLIAYAAASGLPLAWPLRGALGLLLYGVGLLLGQVVTWPELKRLRGEWGV